MSIKVRHHGTWGHFICADRCCFRMHTTVDDRWKVSTVGCYHPLSGDPDKPEPVGAGRLDLYETMVFDLSLPDDEQWHGVSCVRYETEEQAEDGHAAAVAMWVARAEQMGADQ